MNTAASTAEPQRLIAEELRALDDGEFYEIWRRLTDDARSALGPEFFTRFRKISAYRPRIRDGMEAVRAPENETAPQCGGVELICAANVTSEPVRWLWPEWLAAGKLHLIGGAPSTGKTTLALSLAATLTTGGTWPDGSRCAQRGSVLIWSGEDGIADTLKPRLEAMGAELARVHFVGRVTDDRGTRPFDPATDMPELAAAAAAIPDLRTLIVDPVVSAIAGDSHKNAEVRRGLQPLVDFAEARGVAAFGITHFSKGTQGRDPLERLTGSLAFGALARLAFAAAKMKDQAGTEYRAFVRVKSNLGPDGGGFRYTLEPVEFPSGVRGSRIVWGAPLTGEAREILAEADADAETRGAIREAQDFLIKQLKNGGCPTATIKQQAEEAGHNWRTVQEASRRLGVQKKKLGMEGGWVWSLPKAQELPEGAGTYEQENFASSTDSAPSEGGSPKAQETGDLASSGEGDRVEVEI
jgi:putative DNA primase/helicase